MLQVQNKVSASFAVLWIKKDYLAYGRCEILFWPPCQIDRGVHLTLRQC